MVSQRMVDQHLEWPRAEQFRQAGSYDQQHDGNGPPAIGLEVSEYSRKVTHAGVVVVIRAIQKLRRRRRDSVWGAGVLSLATAVEVRSAA
jgi:hypothetical protein